MSTWNWCIMPEITIKTAILMQRNDLLLQDFRLIGHTPQAYWMLQHAKIQWELCLYRAKSRFALMTISTREITPSIWTSRPFRSIIHFINCECHDGGQCRKQRKCHNKLTTWEAWVEIRLHTGFWNLCWWVVINEICELSQISIFFLFWIKLVPSLLNRCFLLDDKSILLLEWTENRLGCVA